MAESATGKCSQCAALATLGLEPGASDKEIRSTYHLLVKVWHPDRFQTDSTTRNHAEEKLKAINEAYRVLREKPRRPFSSHRPSPNHQSSPPQESHQTTTPPRQARQSRAPATAFARILRLIPFRLLALRLAMPAFSVAAAVVVFWLVFKPIDAFLASNPATATYYSAPRAEAASALEQLRENTWDSLHRPFAPTSEAVPLPLPQLTRRPKIPQTPPQPPSSPPPKCTTAHRRTLTGSSISFPTSPSE